MKRTLALLLILAASHAWAASDPGTEPDADGASGSASGSCSDTIEGLGYFYAYTYQYAYVYHTEARSQSHSFSFSGFLSGMESAQLVDATSKHLIYRGPKYDLAVPYVAGAGLYYRNPIRAASSWRLLCDY